MRTLDRYLGRNVAGGTLLALLVLVALDLLFTFINEADQVGKGGYTWTHAVMYIALTLPRRLYEMFPNAVLLGSLLSLGALASNSELIAMRAAGVPVAGIVRSVLKAGLTLMVLAVLLGELVAPVAEQRAQSLRAEAQASDQLSLQGSEGLWARDGNRFLRIDRVLPDMRLLGVKVFEFDDALRMREAVEAGSARFESDQWVLSDVRTSRFEEDRVSVETQSEVVWSRLLSPELFRVIVIKPEQMSAWTLAQYVTYLRDNNLDARRYELAFWIRFTIPLSSLVMLLLAIPFVFGSLRSGSTGQRLFVGLLVGVGFYIFNRTMNHLGLVYGLSPFLSATLPLFVFLGLSLLALRRIH